MTRCVLRGPGALPECRLVYKAKPRIALEIYETQQSHPTSQLFKQRQACLCAPASCTSRVACISPKSQAFFRKTWPLAMTAIAGYRMELPQRAAFDAFWLRPPTCPVGMNITETAADLRRRSRREDRLEMREVVDYASSALDILREGAWSCKDSFDTTKKGHHQAQKNTSEDAVLRQKVVPRRAGLSSLPPRRAF